MKVTNNQQDTSFGTIHLVRFRGKKQPQRVRVAQAVEFIEKKTTRPRPVTQAIPRPGKGVLVLDDSPLATTFIKFQQCKDALIDALGMLGEKATERQREVQSTYTDALKAITAAAKPVNYRAK